MAEYAGEDEPANGVHAAADKVESSSSSVAARLGLRRRALHAALYRMIATVLFPDHASRASGEPLARRIKISLADDGPVLREASRQSGRRVLIWARQGSPLRARSLVVSVCCCCLFRV
ncbi:hypothetical protein NL676_005535 [Syzygium grande]|nr:hypothetical protein NL676_005535 [Syzygium grande]